MYLPLRTFYVCVHSYVRGLIFVSKVEGWVYMFVYTVMLEISFLCPKLNDGSNTYKYFAIYHSVCHFSKTCIRNSITYAFE